MTQPMPQKPRQFGECRAITSYVGKSASKNVLEAFGEVGNWRALRKPPQNSPITDLSGTTAFLPQALPQASSFPWNRR